MVAGATTSPVLTVNNAASYTIALGAASQVSLTTSGSTTAGGSRTLTATIQDAGGNTVTTDNSTQVTFNQSSGTGTAAFPSAATAVNGVATATATNNLIGTMVAGATTSPVLTVNNAASYTIALGAASQVSLTTAGSLLGGGSRTLTATIQDAGGNTVTTDNTTQVTFNKASGTGTANFPAAATAVNGVATATATNQLIGTIVVGATTSPVLTVNNAASYTIAHGAASQLVFTTQPAGATAGSALTTQPVATIEDSAGNTVTTGADSSANVTVTVHSGSGSLQGTTTIAAIGGVATFADLRLDSAGAHTLRAAATLSGPGAVTVDSGSFTVAASGASTLAVTGPATATAGVPFNTLVVTVQDAYGNTVTGYTGTVTFSGGGSGSTLPGDYTFTGGDNGSHAFTATIRQSGNRTLTATDTTTPSITGTTPAIAASAAAAASLRLSGAAAQTAGAVQALTVTAYDAFGNIATGYTGAHAITFGGASFSPAPSTAPTVTDNTAAAVPFGTATTLTFTGGVSTVGGSLRLVDAESATVTASAADGGAGGSTTINAAGADALFVSVSPASLAKFALQLTSPQTNGTAFTGTNTLTAQDAFGNTVTSFDAFGDNVAVTANAPLTGTVSGLHGANVLNSAADFSAGVADLTALTYTGNATSGTFTATSQSSKSGVSGTVSIAVGAAARFVVTGSATQTAGQSQSLTITAVDQSGNTATGYGGDASLTFGGAAAAGSNLPTATDKTGSPVAFGTPTTITFTNGVASAGGSVRLTKAEAALLTVTQGGLTTTGADRLAVTVSPAAASASDSVISASPASITANGVATSTITVQAKDAFGNNRTSGGSTVVLNASRGSLGTVSDAGNGTYTATLTAASSTGTASITGTLGGSPIGTPTSVAFVPGVANAAHSVITTASGSLTANGTSTTAVTLRLKDVNDNDLTAGSGTIVLTTDAGSVGTVTNNGDGTYSATFTAPVVAGTAHITGTLNGTAIGNPATVTLVPGPVSASHSTVVASSGTVSTDTGNTSTVTVTVLDANDNPIQGSHVVLDQGATSSSISPAPVTGADTAPNGVATFTVSDTTAESVVYSATASGTLVNQTAAVLYQPGAPTQLVYGQQPTNATAAATVAPPVTLRILDAHANLTSSNAVVTLAIKAGTGTAGATLAGTATRTASSGIATFNDLLIAKSGTAFRLTATATSLSSADSSTFDIAPGAAAAAHSTLTRAPASVSADGSSAATLTVHAKDVNDNNLTSGGAAVVFHTDLGTLSSVTDNGNGTYTATLTSTTAGAAHLDATLGGVAVANTVTVGFSAGSVPNAGQSVITGAPTSLAAGATSTITVQAKDVNGNALASGGATVVLATDHGALGSVTDNSDGTYSATLNASIVGVAHVTGTLNGVAIGTPATVTFMPGSADAAHTTITASPTTIVANGATTSTITVHAKDANDNNLTTGGATVTLATNRGTLSSVTDAGDGTYTATLTSTSAGDANVTGTLNGVAIAGQVTVTFVPDAVDASHSTVVASSGTASTDAPANATITITVADAHDNPIPGATVTLAANGGSSNISPALGGVSNANGQIAFTVDDAVAQTVVYSATASGTLLIPSASVQFEAGAPTHVVYLQQPTAATSGAAIAPAVTVRILDAQNNLTTSTANVSIAIKSGTGTAGATLGGTTMRAAVAGIATFNDLAIAKAGTGYRLTASSGALTSADSSPFDITPGAVSAADSTITASPATINADGSSGTAAITVRAKDANGNTLTSSGGLVVLATSRGSLSGVTDNGDGTYTASLTATGSSGSANLTGTIGGTAIGHPTSVTFAPPVPVVTIDGGQPAAQTAAASASFTFHSPNDDGNTTFECRLDAAAFTACTSPQNYAGLSDGAHIFRVRGVNGNGPGTAVSASWTVDTTGPTVSLTTSPGAFTNNAVEPLAATASDATTTVASVDFLFAATAGACPTGTLIDTDTSAPYTATWTTPGDGTYVVCAVAHDAVGNASAAPSTTAVTVDQTAPLAALTAPPANVRQTITLHATSVTDATSGVASVTFERSPHSAATWTTIGAGVAQGGNAYDGSFDTTSVADGLYDIRVSVTDAAGNVARQIAGPVRVDNTAPAPITLDPLSANVRQTIALGSSATDLGSGVASTAYEISPFGASTWTPVGASFDTTTKADGDYELRALATDNAGNVGTSASRQVKIDNTPPVATLGAVPAYIRASLTLSSTTTDIGSGLATTRYEISAHGVGSWSTIASPLDTTTKADGDYDVRVVAIDSAGNRTSSPPQEVVIDNTAPSQSDLTAPVAGAILQHGTPTALTATAVDATSLIDTIHYRVATAGTVTGANCNDTLGTQIGSGATTTFDASSLADGHYDMWVAATDHAGNGRCSVLPHDVIVDNTAPTTTDNAPFGAQNTDVTVTLTPGSDLSGVASTEYRVDGGSWTAGTSVTVNAPANHSNDGMHTIDYRSTDAAGNVEATKTTHVTIDTTAPTGSAVDPSSMLTGTVMLTASPSEPDIASVQWLYRPGSSGAYTSIGTDTTAPWQLPWITNALGDGDYELEVIFTDTTGNTTTQTLSTKTIDNTGPASAAVTSPSANAVLSGTIALTSTSSDATSGIDPTRTQYSVKATGDSSFAPVSGTTWNSTTKPDGPAEVEVTVWDRAGNGPFLSAPVAFTVDNTAPSVSLSAPSAGSGTVNLSATGSADIATVDFAYKPQASPTYTAIGSASGPFTSAWATGSLADGLYDVRAIATDHGAHTGTDVQTVRVDNTAPTGSLTAPAAATTVGGPNVSLAANAADSGAGVASVTFQYRAVGALGAFTDIATDTSAPFTATLDSTPLTSGDYDLRGIVTDAAGNTYTTAINTVTVDSTPPSATLNLPAVLAGSAAPLSVTASADAAQATYSTSPAGAGTWAQVASSSTGPAFSATADTTSLADGFYDVRAVVADQFGNTTTVVTSNVRVDNTAPTIVSTSPADGSLMSSVSSMSLTASENISAVNSLRLDGVVPTFTPSISGATATFNVGSLAPGNHALTGWIVDAGGLSSPFRLNVTIPTGSGDVPETTKNVSSVVSTTLGAADDSAMVTVPANIWQQPLPGPQDFLVLHVDPTPSAIGLQGSLQFASMPLSVWMNWELAGSQEHHFDAPLDIVLTDSTGGSGYPVTFENNAWRTIQQLDAPGVLPASWQDGYWRDHGSVHILTRHLSLFALVNSLVGPQAAAPQGVVPARTAPNGVARSPLLFTISLAPRVRLVQKTFAARVLLSGRARIDVTLDAKPFRRIQRWHYMQVHAGATILPLKLRQKLPPGSYRLFWKATSLADGSIVRRITRLQIVGSSRVHAATPPQIVIIDSSGQTIANLPRADMVRLPSEQAFQYATYHDVSVILLNVDSDRIQLLKSLRTVFPSTAVIAFSKDPARLAAAAKAGAIAVPRSTSPAELKALIAHVLAANRALG
jgi:adhesin/invasin